MPRDLVLFCFFSSGQKHRACHHREGLWTFPVIKRSPRYSQVSDTTLQGHGGRKCDVAPRAPEVNSDGSNRAKRQQWSVNVQPHKVCLDDDFWRRSWDAIFYFIHLSMLFHNKCTGSGFSCSVSLPKKWKEGY